MSPRDPTAIPDDDWEDPTDVSVTEVQVEDVLIGGRYLLERLIARGGMSVVHLARHKDLDRLVALKLLKPPKDAEAGFDFEGRFRNEAITHATFSHPNVVTLHDFGQLDDGQCFLAMEYVDGPSLANLIRSGPLPLERAVPLLVQTALALRYTHQRGVVHRDITPANILVTHDPDGRGGGEGDRLRDRRAHRGGHGR